MELSDVWAKLANQARLTPEELDFLKMQGRETQQRNAFVAGNTSPSGGLIVPMPFFPIFNETLEVTQSSFSIPIVPQDYNHLLVLCNGRSTFASVGPTTLDATFNGDTAANYGWQTDYISNGATVSNTKDYASYDASIGMLECDSSPAGESSSSFCFIPNYRSNLHKQLLLFSSGVGSAHSTIGFVGSVWRTTSPILSMSFQPDQGDIKAGSIISIYGIL